jgi:hypothetical protein
VLARLACLRQGFFIKLIPIIGRRSVRAHSYALYPPSRKATADMVVFLWN